MHQGQETREGVVDINYGFPRLSKQGLMCLKETSNICVLLSSICETQESSGRMGAPCSSQVMPWEAGPPQPCHPLLP